jgi:hypothetical protein
MTVGRLSGIEYRISNKEFPMMKFSSLLSRSMNAWFFGPGQGWFGRLETISLNADREWLCFFEKV